MKFLVTGGAGFLGINLIRYLLNKGHETVSLDIVPFDYKDVRDKVEIITGDIRDLQTVRTSMKGIDIVVHTAAALPLYSPEEIYTTDVKGTELLLSEAYSSGVKRFIHISSTAVYG
ncbi:MAG: NAD-dependent epimerase/dehydratase family protein, partial [Methanococcaceae archaeon]